jgi:hypothetical protein
MPTLAELGSRPRGFNPAAGGRAGGRTEAQQVFAGDLACAKTSIRATRTLPRAKDALDYLPNTLKNLP